MIVKAYSIWVSVIFKFSIVISGNVVYWIEVLRITQYYGIFSDSLQYFSAIILNFTDWRFCEKIALFEMCVETRLVSHKVKRE